MELDFKAKELERYYLDYFVAKVLGHAPAVQLMSPTDRCLIYVQDRAGFMVQQHFNPTVKLDEIGKDIERLWPQIRPVLYSWHGDNFCYDATQRGESLVVWYLRALVASVLGENFTDSIRYI